MRIFFVLSPRHGYDYILAAQSEALSGGVTMPRARTAFLGWITTLLFLAPARGQEPTMVAHYIDVGQGLSVLLEFPCGAVLIDTGSQDLEHIDHLSGYLRDFFKRRSDLQNTL